MSPRKQHLPPPDKSVWGRMTKSFQNMLREAMKWEPKKSGAVTPFATMGRYAMRLVDLETGKAYSADELPDYLSLVAVTSVAGRTGDVILVSTDVTDASVGATDDSAADLVAKFDFTGGITSNACTSNSFNIANDGSIVGPGDSGLHIWRMPSGDAILALTENADGTTSNVRNYVAKTASYTLASTDYTVNWTGGTCDGTLETAVSAEGRIHVLKNSGTGTVTVKTTSGQTIDGNASGALTLAQYESLTVQSDGANWIII